MIPDLSAHGPATMKRMERDGLRWPVFTGREMGDLISYLNMIERLQDRPRD